MGSFFNLVHGITSNFSFFFLSFHLLLLLFSSTFSCIPSPICALCLATDPCWILCFYIGSDLSLNSCNLALSCRNGFSIHTPVNPTFTASTFYFFWSWIHPSSFSPCLKCPTFFFFLFFFFFCILILAKLHCQLNNHKLCHFDHLWHDKWIILQCLLSFFCHSQHCYGTN